jgi:hypothetical protein
LKEDHLNLCECEWLQPSARTKHRCTNQCRLFMWYSIVEVGVFQCWAAIGIELASKDKVDVFLEAAGEWRKRITFKRLKLANEGYS